MAETTRRPTGSAPAAPVVKDTDPELTSGQSVEETKTPAGYAGLAGFEDSETGSAESKSAALKRAQILAPHLTKEFVDAYKIDDETVRGIADGQVSPPPVIGPNHTSDLYLTPGGWVQTKPGVPLGESTAISR
jgi:hypothetical protein